MNWKNPLLLLVPMAVVVPYVSMMHAEDAAAGTNPAAAETQRVDNSTPLKVDRLDPSVDRIDATTDIYPATVLGNESSPYRTSSNHSFCGKPELGDDLVDEVDRDCLSNN